MSKVRFVNSTGDISLNSRWTPVDQFKSKNQTVEENGRKYCIIEKWECKYSKSERIARGVLGVLIAIPTCCLALFSKQVRNLIFKHEKAIRFALLQKQARSSSADEIVKQFETLNRSENKSTHDIIEQFDALTDSQDNAQQIEQRDRLNNKTTSTTLTNSQDNMKAIVQQFETIEESESKSQTDHEIIDAIANPPDSTKELIQQFEPLSLSQNQTISAEATSALSEEEQKIIEQLTPQMVEALGGIKQVLSFPVLKEWTGIIENQHLTAPVQRGYHNDGRAFLLFCYVKQSESKVTGEYLGRAKDGGWEGANAWPSEINLRAPNSIRLGSLEEKYMLDKVSRLINHRAVGCVKLYPGVVLFKPNDKKSFFPKDAYLDEPELLTFMDLDTIFYERKPKDGFTEVFLYDRRMTAEENKKMLKHYFPAMKV